MKSNVKNVASYTRDEERRAFRVITSTFRCHRHLRWLGRQRWSHRSKKKQSPLDMYYYYIKSYKKIDISVNVLLLDCDIHYSCRLSNLQKNNCTCMVAVALLNTNTIITNDHWPLHKEIYYQSTFWRIRQNCWKISHFVGRNFQYWINKTKLDFVIIATSNTKICCS